jgi:hypothetical protein
MFATNIFDAINRNELHNMSELESRVLELLKQRLQGDESVSTYRQIANKILAENPNNKTSEGSIGWYACHFKKDGFFENLPLISEVTEVQSIEEMDLQFDSYSNIQPSEIALMKYLRQDGWEVDFQFRGTMGNEQSGFDILAIKGDDERHIEVKYNERGNRKYFQLTPRQTIQLLADEKFWVYRVQGSLESLKERDITAINASELRMHCQFKLIARYSRV